MNSIGNRLRVVQKLQTGLVKTDIESEHERRDVVGKQDGHNQNKEMPAKNLAQFLAQFPPRCPMRTYRRLARHAQSTDSLFNPEP